MKKRKVPRAVAAQQQAPKLNPFELKGSRKKFDVLGKRDKTDKKNIIQSREEAFNKRKKTLLVEYKQLRKANTFIDRRFGEDDPQLNEEDKALARFQVHRIKEARKATKFALSGEDDEAAAAARAAGGGAASRRGSSRSKHTLTHGGISLEELEELNSRPAELLADLDDDMLEELVTCYHFGGGGGADQGGQQQGHRAAAAAGGGRPLTKKEIMEEIIAKSKAAKAEKASQREADENALRQLDETFKSLVGQPHAGLAALLKPPGFDKGKKVKAESAADADYDKAARELAFEAKGQASDAALTKEELEEKEAARLAALEAARLKRMRADTTAGGGDDAEDDLGAEAEAAAAAAELLPKGGYAAKRARAKLEAEREERRQRRKLDPSGDALGDDFASDGEAGDDDEGEEDSDEEGGVRAANALEARRQAAAAGGHPLQMAFRQAAAQLAAKHGLEVEQQQDDEEDDEDEEGSEDEEGEEGGSSEPGSGDLEEGAAAAAAGSRKRARTAAAEGSDDDDGVDDDGGGSDDADEDEEQQSGSADCEGGSSQAEEDEEEEEEEDARPHPTKLLKQQQQQQNGPSSKAAAAADELEGPLDLSFTPAVPESYQEFEALVANRPPDQLQLAIQRIRTFNAAALATDSKRKLQVFYGILVQHFALLAGHQPVPVAHLDVLTQTLLQLTPEVPFYAATVARTRLDKLHQRLAAALSDPLEAGGPLLGWPGSRQLLQLRLFALLFPASDRRHPVTTPLALLMGKYLMQCPVNSPYQAALGLLLAGLALHNAAAAARFCPEAVNFVASTLRAYVPCASTAAAAAAAGGKQKQQPQKAAAAAAAAVSAGVSRFTPGLLVLDSCSSAAATTGNGVNNSKGSSKKQRPQQQQQADVLQQEQLPSVKLYHLLSSAPDAAEFSVDAFKLQLLGCAVATANRIAQLSHGCGAAAPQVLQPLLDAAEEVAQLQGLPPAAAAAVQDLLQELRSTIAGVVDKRQPMVQSHRIKVVLPREYNPRYEADFNSAADYDPDRQRSEARKLKRQLVKEKRGAMRELRRDASFMAAERDAEKSRVDSERLASERSFYSELQRQEADAKSGGQRGMNPHRKKKGK